MSMYRMTLSAAQIATLKLANQERAYLRHMFQSFENEVFDLSAYTKSLGYANKDLEVFGSPTKGNMINNFNYYATQFRKEGYLKSETIVNTLSDKKKIKDLEARIVELEALLEEATK